MSIDADIAELQDLIETCENEDQLEELNAQLDQLLVEQEQAN